jgi:hypothetical protein
MCDPSQEIRKTYRFYLILQDLDKKEKIRVLLWIISKFQLEEIRDLIPAKTAQTTPPDHTSSHGVISADTSFLEVLRKNADQKNFILALIAAAYLQQELGLDKFRSWEINKVLKDQGFQLKNISMAIKVLMKQKPRLLEQISSTPGTTTRKQQRPQLFYQVTRAGIKLANAYRKRTGAFKLKDYLDN